VSELTPKERRDLRARAHHLQPVVMIGEAGLTEQVIREIEANLRSHELIKIRTLVDGRGARDELVSALCAATAAQPVQQIGKVLVVYRAYPPEHPNNAKRRPGRKPRRKTKRSFQMS
jgi:putative YhbY family RNA-binding protein